MALESTSFLHRTLNLLNFTWWLSEFATVRETADQKYAASMLLHIEMVFVGFGL